MKVINSKKINIKESAVVTIGNFDGIHIGHKKLIDTLEKSIIDDIGSKVVLSFYPHPLEYIKGYKVKTILSQREKEKELLSLGIDYFIKYPFDENTMNMEAKEFFIEVIVDKLNCKTLVVGECFKFGKGNKGDIKFLKTMCSNYNIKLYVVENRLIDKVKVSSSNIRKLVMEHSFKEIEKRLNKKFYMCNKVIEGKKIGRTLGFRTANIKIRDDKIVPPNGVYYTYTTVCGKKYDSVTNIGITPTFENCNRSIETHIINFNKDIYGEEIKLEFNEFIRGEKKFKNVRELMDQIELDIQFVKNKLV